MRPASVHQSARVPALQFFRVHAYLAVLDTVVQHQYRGGHEWEVQLSPHPITSAGFAQQQQQQQPGMQGQMGQFGYGMLGMGLPSGMLGGFGYAGQSGTFGQVRACFVQSTHVQ